MVAFYSFCSLIRSSTYSFLMSIPSLWILEHIFVILKSLSSNSISIIGTLSTDCFVSSLLYVINFLLHAKTRDFTVFHSRVLNLSWQAAVMLGQLDNCGMLAFGVLTVRPVQPLSRARCGLSWISVESPEWSIGSWHYGHWKHQCVHCCVTPGVCSGHSPPAPTLYKAWALHPACMQLHLQPETPVAQCAFLLCAASSSLVCCPANLSPVGRSLAPPPFPPALVWVLLPCAVVWKTPRQEARVNVDFTSVFLLSRFPSLHHV